jgi:hypothetical protein
MANVNGNRPDPNVADVLDENSNCWQPVSYMRKERKHGMFAKSLYPGTKLQRDGRVFARRPWLAALLAIALAWVGLSAVQPAFAGAPYRARDNYILVKSCVGAACARAADWAPAVQRLHQQFLREGWGKDPAVVSRNAGTATTWGAWAAEHLSYVDGPNQRAIRAELSVVYQDLLRSGAPHVIRVPVVR